MVASLRQLLPTKRTIKRNEKTMARDVCLNDVLFESFRGDGLSVSTPTGQPPTINLWVAVLHPTIEALQLTELRVLIIVFTVP